MEKIEIMLIVNYVDSNKLTNIQTIKIENKFRNNIVIKGDLYV